MSKRKLTPQQQEFVIHYAEGMSATQAAVAAGYSEKTAGQQGHRLLKNVEVKAELKRLREKAVKRATVTAADVLDGLARNAELGATIGPDGKPLSLGASTQALGLLGKHFRLFIDRTEVRMSDDVLGFLDHIISIIEDEVTDEPTRNRIMARLSVAGRGHESESSAFG